MLPQFICPKNPPTRARCGAVRLGRLGALLGCFKEQDGIDVAPIHMPKKPTHTRAVRCGAPWAPWGALGVLQRTRSAPRRPRRTAPHRARVGGFFGHMNWGNIDSLLFFEAPQTEPMLPQDPRSMGRFICWKNPPARGAARLGHSWGASLIASGRSCGASESKTERCWHRIEQKMLATALYYR